MSAIKEKNGTWYVKYHLSGQREVHKRGFATKREAMAWERMKRSEGSQVSITFGAMALKFVDNSAGNKYTRHAKEYRLTTYCSSFWETPIYKIKKSQLLDWRAELQKNGKSTSTNNTIMELVRAVYRYAGDYYDIPNTASVLRSFQKSKDTVQDLHVWTVEQFKAFESCISHPVYRAYFHTLYWTGLRKGKAVALYKTDLQDHLLVVNKTLSRGEVHRPKTLSSRRDVRLDDATYQLLLDLSKRPGQYLFGDEGMLSTTQIDRYFEKGSTAAKLPKIRIHDLRHSHATNLINAGAKITAVSSRLGHADVSVTLRVYTHLLQTAEDESVGIINDLAKKGPKRDQTIKKAAY